MRYLLLSDTHGQLEAIDALAERTGADAVIHAGDLGFYDEQSPDRLEARELFLRVVHSDLPEGEKARARRLRSEDLRAFIRQRLPLSDLGRWLREGRGFRVPVYAVWGNHEDRAVLEDLLAGRAAVPNLHLIHEGASHRVGPLRLFGLGGNLIPERLAEAPSPLAGGGGKVWTTLAQLGQLVESLEAAAQPGEVRVFVSHLSPGREPALEWVAARLGAQVTVSGHMGSPWAVVWSEFGCREAEEANARLAAVPAQLSAALQAPLPEDPALRARVERARELLRQPPEPALDRRGERLPSWFRGAFHINLPDAPDGHALLVAEAGRLRLETCSEGLWLPRG